MYACMFVCLVLVVYVISPVFIEFSNIHKLPAQQYLSQLQLISGFVHNRQLYMLFMSVVSFCLHVLFVYMYFPLTISLLSVLKYLYGSSKTVDCSLTLYCPMTPYYGVMSSHKPIRIYMVVRDFVQATIDKTN